MKSKNSGRRQQLALCIGINDYPGTNSDLYGCVNDANDWSEELTSRGFDCRQLLDAKATKERILDGIQRLAKRARAGDTVVITFSGHGSFVVDESGDESDGLDECLCAYDVASAGPLTDDELHRAFLARAAGVRWILISDSCHSGTVARYSPSLGGDRAQDGRGSVRFLPPSLFSKSTERRFSGSEATTRRSASPPGREGILLLSGCQDDEYSYDATFAGRPNGAFTYVALAELRNLPERASYEEWFARIRDRLPTQDYPQAPNLFGPEWQQRWPVLQPGSDEDAEEPESREPSSPGLQCAQRIGRSLARDALARAPRWLPDGEQARAQKIPLLAEGDSWFDYPFHDVLECLEDDHGYDCTAVSHAGDNVEDMAYSGGQLTKLLRTFDKMIRKDEVPRAVLLSGGGNDIAGEPFEHLLNHSSSPVRGLNATIADAFINERIRDSYATIIHSLTELCEDRLGRRLPVVIHGYSYAVPDGRGFLGGWWKLPGPWLKPGFTKKGYSDASEMQHIIDSLIDRMNNMQRHLVQQPGFEHVHHLDLRDVFPRGGDYQRWWANELHPTKRGWALVADRYAAKLSQL